MTLLSFEAINKKLSNKRNLLINIIMQKEIVQNIIAIN